MNQSAAQMLGVDAAGVQRKSILEVVRNGELQKFVSRAVAGPDPWKGKSCSATAASGTCRSTGPCSAMPRAAPSAR